jgi:hypothetical protein
MVGAGCLEKFLEVIGRLPCLALEIMLNNRDVLLIRVSGLLVLITLIPASGDRDSLVSPLQPSLVTLRAPLVTFGASLCSFPSHLE